VRSIAIRTYSNQTRGALWPSVDRIRLVNLPREFHPFRVLCEQLSYNMLCRWFVGLGMEDLAWDHSTYTQNRNRLIDHQAVSNFQTVIKRQGRAHEASSRGVDHGAASSAAMGSRSASDQNNETKVER